MKTSPSAQGSGWNVSFWFAVSSPFFVDDRGNHEHNDNRLRFDHSTVRFRFDRTGQDPPETQLRLMIAREMSEF